MSIKREQAIKFFNSGFNCSQSVFACFCEDYGLDRRKALKIGCGFGGGMRLGEVCGAVSGAIMVIGLKFGNFNVEDTDAKLLCYVKTTEFCQAFRDRSSSVICKELLECDISTEDGMRQAKEKGLFATTCVGLIKKTVELLEELGY